jgi:hypothetical protein
MVEPFQFNVILPGKWLRKLRQFGGDPGTHMQVAVRAYLERWKRANPGVPLPFENGMGRLAYLAEQLEDQRMTEITWKNIPDDIRVALAWGDGAGTHIRVALQQYLSEHWKPGMDRTAPPSSKAPVAPPPMEISISRELLNRVKALGPPLGEHFEKAVRQYRHKYNRESFSEELPPHYRNAGRIFDGSEAWGSGCAEIRWQGPADLRNVTNKEILAALRLYLQGMEGLRKAISRVAGL